ncbi:hypothetical protein COV17_00275 [Candidatus Woesearchaeota archaeon CG10_big_fil_rev_8_21_14_0_10_36_11]|nr:MAG: hypothetical protein COV17_00275 [Candidatus Woesearchaeota archaeon CG10_big_fil_rev_8_21_14_0_10_36_11]
MPQKKKSQHRPFIDFLQHKHVLSILTIFIIVGGFLILALLSDSEEAMIGEAQRTASEGIPDPYFLMYNYYSFYTENPTFEKLDDALYKSNVFLKDAFIAYGEERAVMKNTYSSTRKLVNRVYANVQPEKFQEIAQWLIIEDSFKELVLDVSMDEIVWVNIPVDPVIFGTMFDTRIMGSQNQLYFVDCLSAVSSVDAKISPEQIAFCMQVSEEIHTMKLWNPSG